MPEKPEYAMNEADREGATNADPVLDINADVGGRAMPVDGTISPCGDSANTYPDYLEQHLGLSALICPDLNQEGEAAHKITSLLMDGVKPGVLLTLARFTDDTASFNRAVNNLCAARAFPDEAETCAAYAMDEGNTDHQKDVIWSTVMFAAAEAQHKDHDWKRLSEISVALAFKIGGAE